MHPSQPQQPYQQQPQYGQPQPYPAQPYGQQYPPPGYGQPMMPQQQPVQVAMTGRAVTKPAWTIGDFLWIICTAGLALPIIWLKRRSKTTVTRYR
ncbi:hypothetical protein [Nonomuraea sp. NPDC023979]|uniref:hypothetical protein n=1 Tax=Nonomuraea sp. NPDC023979 TaxID=3154796 RepID=UPI00340487AA